MSGQVSRILEPLADAIGELDLPVDSAVLTEAFALMDRLNAKLLAAVGEHDAAELWRNDGATSMTAWLRHHTRHAGRDAARCAKTARRLRQLPVTATAYRDGVLSAGQVQAIVANLHDRTICRRFLDHQQTRRGGRHRPHLNTGSSPTDAPRSWTTAPPPAPSPLPCSTP